jgi:antitoxin component of RelBE/YafQ-DinJ toxin-antitoxin module
MGKYNKDKNDNIKFRIDLNIKNDFYIFCKKNGYSVSERIRILLENDMKNGKE